MYKAINQLLSANYTVVFIGHEQKKDGDKIRPNGDKRLINPIVNLVDYVVYLKSNGVDDKGKVIPSSAYLAETNEFFARSRFDTTPTFLTEFTVEALTEAINIGVEEKAKQTGAKLVTYDQQKEQNTTVKVNFDELKKDIGDLAYKFHDAGQDEILSEMRDEVLGAGHAVKDCTVKQTEALEILFSTMKDKAAELEIA